VLVLPAREWSSPLVPLLGEEIIKDEPGQEAVLDRLLDLLLIAVLRAWFARPDAAPSGLVLRLRRPGGGPRATAVALQPGAPMDCG
jgi:Cupin